MQHVHLNEIMVVEMQYHHLMRGSLMTQSRSLQSLKTLCCLRPL